MAEKRGTLCRKERKENQTERLVNRFTFLVTVFSVISAFSVAKFFN